MLPWFRSKTPASLLCGFESRPLPPLTRKAEAQPEGQAHCQINLAIMTLSYSTDSGQSASDRPIDVVLDSLEHATGYRPKKTSSGWQCRCPSHDDDKPSLSISEGRDGKVLLHDHAGCRNADIVRDIGLTLADLFPSKGRSQKRRKNRRSRSHNSQNGKTKPKKTGSENNGNKKRRRSEKRRIEKTYKYRDENGQLVYEVVRYIPKDFRQRRPKKGGGYSWSVKGLPKLPYRLPEILSEESLTRPIVIVEGEKDADNLAGLNILATCCSGGAGNWTDEHSGYLAGRPVVILPDNDDAGRRHAEMVADSMLRAGSLVLVFHLPGLDEKEDPSDWIAKGGTKEVLNKLLDEDSGSWRYPQQQINDEATPTTDGQAEPTAEQPKSSEPEKPAVATPPEPEEWPELQPFEKPELPQFPVEALPKVLSDWVNAVSVATQTPPDLAAMLALAVCAAALAGKVVMVARPGWIEPVNLFIAVLLEPGNRKSAVFQLARQPLEEIEAELIEQAAEDVARQQSDRRQMEKRLASLEKKAADGDDEARVEALSLAAEIVTTPEAFPPRLIIDDATSEKIEMIMSQQGGRIASMSPEGGVFDLMAGLYSKSGLPQFSVYLKGHSGDDLITDRVGRKTVRVERPALTCGYAIQPEVIDNLAEKSAFRGRGLLGRFLYASPKSWIGEREIAAPPVSPKILIAYHTMVRRLAELGANDEQFQLKLSVEAQETLQQWEKAVEAMLGEGGDMETMCDWGAKLVGQTLRIAAILHCIQQDAGKPVSDETVSSAVRIAQYLIPHAETVLEMMSVATEPTEADAQYVLRWIDRHDLTEFSVRDAHQHGKKRFPKVDLLEPPLKELISRGFIRLLPPPEEPKPGRPPSPRYEVNPKYIESRQQGKCSHNSHNVGKQGSESDSGNIVDNIEVIGSNGAPTQTDAAGDEREVVRV